MRKLNVILPVLSLLLTLSACQTEPAPQNQTEPDTIIYVRTSVQPQPDGDYGIWEYNADQTLARFSSYDVLGNFRYRINYQYDQQGRLTVEEHQSLAEDGSTRKTHIRTYNYSDVDVVIAVSDFGYEGAACGFTMTDPAHHVNIEHIGVTDGKVTELTIEELDEEGIWVTEQRIVLEQ